MMSHHANNRCGYWVIYDKFCMIGHRFRIQYMFTLPIWLAQISKVGTTRSIWLVYLNVNKPVPAPMGGLFRPGELVVTSVL